MELIIKIYNRDMNIKLDDPRLYEPNVFMYPRSHDVLQAIKRGRSMQPHESSGSLDFRHDTPGILEIYSMNNFLKMMIGIADEYDSRDAYSIELNSSQYINLMPLLVVNELNAILAHYAG